MPKLRRRAQTRRPVADELSALLAGKKGAERVLAFFRSCLVHAKGDLAGQPFEPLEFQKEILRGLYDPITATGHRKIRNGLLFLPRKSGKTTLSAAISVYETFGALPGAQVVCAANSRDQASELFSIAADYVEMSPILAARAVVSRAKKQIFDRVTRSTFRAVSADAGTAHGKDLTCWIYDELHAAKNRLLYDVLATSTGARKEALGLVISTAGFTKVSVLGEVFEHGQRVIADPQIDPSFYAYLAQADESLPWDSEETWRAANPALGAFRDLEEMRIMCQRARQIPAQKDAFKRLYLNIWTAAESGFLDMADWDQCGDGVTDEEIEGVPAWCGLDLSSNTDLTAFVMLFCIGERIFVRHRVWLPEDGLHERELRDRVPYGLWAERGLVTLTQGNCIDMRLIVQDVIELSKKYRIGRINFDRWGAADVTTELQGAGLEVIPIGQGYASISAPTKALQNAILSRRIGHGGCPVLRWQASCCSVVSDPAGNVKIVKPDRLKYTKRVDSIVAMAMAMDAVMRCAQQKAPIYNVHWISKTTSYHPATS